MKKALLFFLLFVSCCRIAYCQSSPNLQNVNLDEKNGFRDVHFGMPLAQIKGLVLLENDGNEKYYKRPTDKLTIGDGRLTKIIYCFYKGRLSGIMFDCAGIVNSTAVRKVLEASYGEGYKSNEYIDRWSWFGEKVGMSFEMNAISHDGSCHISSREIAAQKRADEDEKAEKSKGDI